MSMLTIEIWLDSGANHESTYMSSFEIDEAEWVAMTDEQKDDYARDVAWDRMDWGWKVKGEPK